jgi:hypothetical protein
MIVGYVLVCQRAALLAEKAAVRVEPYRRTTPGIRARGPKKDAVRGLQETESSSHFAGDRSTSEHGTANRCARDPVEDYLAKVCLLNRGQSVAVRARAQCPRRHRAQPENRRSRL